jgi:hypothetical protein
MCTPSDIHITCYSLRQVMWIGGSTTIGINRCSPSTSSVVGCLSLSLLFPIGKLSVEIERLH